MCALIYHLSIVVNKGHLCLPLYFSDPKLCEDLEEFKDLTLKDFTYVGTLGMGGFGRVELVCYKWSLDGEPTLYAGSTKQGQNKDVCSQVFKEKAHSRYTSAGTHLFREKDHVGCKMSLHSQVHTHPQWNLGPDT